MLDLSSEAQRILQFAAASDGTVMLLDFLSGTAIQVDGVNLLDGVDRAEQARMRSGVEQLLRHGLIEDRAGKHELFFLTGPGFDVAALQSPAANG
jgi:hypothetical protein